MRTWHGLACVGLSLCLSGCAVMREGTSGTEGPTLHGMAKALPEQPGAPKACDVCMRSLRPRPANAKDPHNTLDAMRGFHVTWLEWTYGNNAEFIRRVHDMGATFGGAVAAGSYLGDQPSQTWNVRDLDGNPVYATWMRAWKRPNPWGCANHPEFRAGHVRAAIAAVKAGADVLQRDEPGQNKHALNWGGCFCEHCMAGFRVWLQEHGDADVLQRLGIEDLERFDYKAYLREHNAPVGDDFGRWKGDELKEYFHAFQIASTVEFNRWWREELNRAVGRRIPVSCNNGVHRWTDIEQQFDYWIGELSSRRATPEHLYEAMRHAVELGKTQSVTMPLRRTGPQESVDWIRHTRQTIATVYATGGHIEMPWDTYLPTPDAQRYFGLPENYADLTAFVRGMAHVLEGYADAFAGGGDIVDDRWLYAPAPVTLMNADGVAVFARARPGQAMAPVAIHLVDWREAPEPFTISLRPHAFFGSRPLRMRLLTPMQPYDKDVHDKAYRTGDYSALVRETTLARGFTHTVSIPRLTPWGVLLVEPETDAAPGLWPPIFAGGDTDFSSQIKVVLESIDPDARIHYTLDGTIPSAASPLYVAPVTIREDRTVSAISVRNGVSSAVASAPFVKRKRPPNLIDNGEFDMGLDGWKRIVWDEAGKADEVLVASIDTNEKLSGPNSVRLDIRKPTGTVYHLRLIHPFQARPGAEYTLSFRAMADGPVRCRVGLQAENAPHKVLGMRHLGIGTTPHRHTVTGHGLQEGDATAYLIQFDVGAAENAGRALWIDDVHLAESPAKP